MWPCASPQHPTLRLIASSHAEAPNSQFSCMASQHTTLHPTRMLRQYTYGMAHILYEDENTLICALRCVPGLWLFSWTVCLRHKADYGLLYISNCMNGISRVKMEWNMAEWYVWMELSRGKIEQKCDFSLRLIKLSRILSQDGEDRHRERERGGRQREKVRGWARKAEKVRGRERDWESEILSTLCTPVFPEWLNRHGDVSVSQSRERDKRVAGLIQYIFEPCNTYMCVAHVSHDILYII